MKIGILAKPARGAIEVWQLENNSGGWSHPVHIHLVDFQIISRTGGKRSVLPYEKEALKDVVLLGENEKVQVIARYAPWDGIYMFHCHNLIHEDHDMMAAFNITSLSNWGYPETTKFIDPMEQKYRSKDENPADFTEQAIQNRLWDFYMMDAYKDPYKVEEALAEYWANGGPSQSPKSTTLSTSTVAAASSTNPSASAASPSASSANPSAKAASSTKAPSPTPTITKAPSPTTTRRSSSSSKTSSTRTRR